MIRSALVRLFFAIASRLQRDTKPVVGIGTTDSSTERVLWIQRGAILVYAVIDDEERATIAAGLQMEAWEIDAVGQPHERG